MNKVIKILLILGFVSLGAGIIIFSQSLWRGSLEVPGDSKAIEIWALSFWYIEPIIGIFLLLATKKRVTKICGAFFLIVSLCAWVNYFFLK